MLNWCQYIQFGYLNFLMGLYWKVVVNFELKFFLNFIILSDMERIFVIFFKVQKLDDLIIFQI